jgi:uncharacterized protein YjiS (DUF1127 family)
METMFPLMRNVWIHYRIEPVQSSGLIATIETIGETMRDFVFHQAQARDSAFVFPKLRRLVRSWIAKRKLRRLEHLDDYLLNDIGLTRDDLRAGLRLPYDVDPIDEIARLRDQRMRRGVRGR